MLGLAPRGDSKLFRGSAELLLGAPRPEPPGFFKRADEGVSRAGLGSPSGLQEEAQAVEELGLAGRQERPVCGLPRPGGSSPFLTLGP